VFEINCNPLTPERRKLLSKNEIPPLSKAVRGILAAGGFYLFYYGTSPGIPDAVHGAAIAFAIGGLVAVVLAIFSQKLIELHYFSKAMRQGRFPKSVSVGEGGLFIKHQGADANAATGITSVNAERFVAFAEVDMVEEQEAYLKVCLGYGKTPEIFLFNDDFVKGRPEALAAYLRSK